MKKKYKLRKKHMPSSKPRFKYQEGQDIIILSDITTMVDWDTGSPQKIEDLFVDYYDKVFYLRYKVCGLWFNQEEIIGVSLKDNPEYYL